MRIKHFYKLILISLLCLTLSLSYAQSEETLEDVSKRVKALENQKQLRDLLEKKFEEKSKEIDKEFKIISDEIKVEQKRNNYVFTTLIIVLGLFGVGGIASLWQLKKFVDYKSREYAEKIIKENFEKEEKKILELLKKQDEEFILKNEKKILVLTPVGSDDSFMRNFFDKMKFKKVYHYSSNNLSLLHESNLVLFNNEDKTFDHNDILDVIKQTKRDVVFFYFGPDRFDSGEFKDRVNFANAKVQIYGNLINLLRYQEIL